MDTGPNRGYRDAGLLPPLSLGLSSVRFIVNKLEAEYSRACSTDTQIVKYDPTVDDDYDSPLETSSGTVLNRFVDNLGALLSRCIPSVSFANFGALAVLAGFFAPRMISYLVLYPFCRLIFGTLYPAYASYKAVRTKNLKEYVKWMMYWIVFALFTCMETFTDVFLSWFPFYYEVKIVLVLWLLSPATKGSSILYRKFVHPALCRREQEIDEYIAKAKDQGYHTVLNLGTKGVNYATTVIMQTAIKGGGGLVQQIRKSYSLSDLTECDPRDERTDEADDVMAEPQLIRRNVGRSGVSTRRSASESNTRSAIYFSEVDVDVRSPRARCDEPDFSHIKSTEDISSGYSSADNSGASLARAGSVGARVRPRAARTAVTAIKRPQAAEDSEVIIEEVQDEDIFDYSNMPALMNVPSPLFLSHSEPPFIYQYVGDQIRIVQVLGDSSFNTNIRATEIKDNFYDTNTKDQKDRLNKDDVETVEVKNELQDVFEEAETESVAERNKFVQNPVAEVTASEKASEHIDTNSKEETKQILETDNKYHCDKSQPLTKENNDETNNDGINPVEVTVPINKDYSDKIQPLPEETKDEIKHDPTSPIEITVPFHSSEVEEPLPVRKEETTSLDTSPNENESSDSDDEASFGTPENSPKSKRKSPRGRYGKGKAPLPPKKPETDNDYVKLDKTSNSASLTTSQESLVDLLNTLPNKFFKETGGSNSLVVNPIAEKKKRHKSKSPGRISKTSSTTIGKLLQIPSKLAFWQKNDKSKGDNLSISSGDHSRRSSTYEKADDFQSCSELNKIIPLVVTDSTINEKADEQVSLNDASDIESEVMTHDIMEKSDALQKLIEAKRQTHPEYKYSNLEDEIPTTSKSTDV